MSNRLREALEAARDWRGLDGDGITDPVRQMIIAALSAEPETCKWTWHQDWGFDCACDGQVRPMPLSSGPEEFWERAHRDSYCPGCGRPIKWKLSLILS